MSIIRTFFAALLLTLLISPVAIAKQPFTLDNIHQDLQSRYEGVSHIGPTQLQKALSGPDSNKYLVLDSRETSEFAVSHIKGAKRVDPSIWHSSFMSKFAKQAKGKTVVIYCSVGERSSKLAKYVQQALMKQGATGVYNLQGGIFKWHNDQRDLTNNTGATKFVHPYDKHWGQLVQRDKLLRYSPK
ncbi:MAG: rhodanese-like domain-containing protein [bacterium]|nr:rhodanese-like domain-containing protein [bacterium]